MFTLGYIISERKITNIKGFVECVKDISLADSTKPILIVGYKNAKTFLGDNFDILNKKISDKMFWTFNKTERRIDFDEDIKNFYQFCIDNIINNIKYYYINIINLKYNKIKKLYNILLSQEKKYIYINDGMIYFYFMDNKILGISLRILKYCGISVKKIISKLKLNSSNIIVNSSNPFVRSVKKEIINKDYIVPFFLKINEENKLK